MLSLLPFLKASFSVLQEVNSISVTLLLAKKELSIISIQAAALN